MIHTQNRTYKRPISKLVLLLPEYSSKEGSPLVGGMLELKKKMSYTAPKARSTQDIPSELYGLHI